VSNPTTETSDRRSAWRAQALSFPLLQESKHFWGATTLTFLAARGR
jgi:hypothetical protein